MTAPDGADRTTIAAGRRKRPVGLPGPAPQLLAYWGSMGEERDPEAELAWRVEHWRLLAGVTEADPQWLPYLGEPAA